MAMTLTLETGPSREGGWWARVVEMPRSLGGGRTREEALLDAQRNALHELADRRGVGNEPWPAVDWVGPE